jgi:hypothetical protein
VQAHKEIPRGHTLPNSRWPLLVVMVYLVCTSNASDLIDDEKRNLLSKVAMLTSWKARTAGSVINTLTRDLSGDLQMYDHHVVGNRKSSRSTPLQPCTCLYHRKLTSHPDLTNLSPSERLNYGVLDGNEVELWGYTLLPRPRF